MDESNGFTQYGLVPSGPMSLSKRLGNMSLSVLGDLTNRVLQGDVSYDTPIGTVGASKQIGSPTNVYGSYQGDGFQVNATDKSLDTSFQIPMVDRSNSMNAGVKYDGYSKTPEVYGQFHKQLSDNGFVDASGRLTPKGYDLMIKGGFSF
jgi:hypothetical protein